jgi:hypothetical protein
MFRKRLRRVPLDEAEGSMVAGHRRRIDADSGRDSAPQRAKQSPVAAANVENMGGMGDIRRCNGNAP